MISSINTKVAAVLLGAAPALAALGLVPAAHATEDGMHGDPGAAAPYWRYQQQDRDCGEVAVADVVGEITGHLPGEDEINATAGNIPSGSHPGPIYRPGARTSNGDLAILLGHYGIQAASIHTNIGALEQDLDQGRKVIAGVNNRILWNEGGNRSEENHFVVVTGIDTRAGVVHMNDPGARAGRDEQLSIATFEASWATSNNFAVVTG